MTIKVTHRGTAPSEIVYNGHCRTCNSTMQCLEADGERRSDQREGYQWVDIRCPVCGATVHCYPHKPATTLSSSQFSDPPNFMDR